MKKEKKIYCLCLLFITSFLFTFILTIGQSRGEGRWVQDGESLNLYSKLFVYAISTRHALNPSIVINNDIPYVAWIEINVDGISQLYVKKLTNKRWEQVGGALNLDNSMPASSPSIAVDDKFIYVSWIEMNEDNVPQLYVKKWTGSDWKQLGAKLNIFFTKYTTTPSIALQGSTPYVAWIELNRENVSQLFVKKWTGSRWEQIGESLNAGVNFHATSPSIAFEGEAPYVAWSEINDKDIFQIFVKKWTGSRWKQIGESLNVGKGFHATSPSIAFEGEAPYVAWSETNDNDIFQIYVKRWIGSRWKQIGESLNVGKGFHASGPSIAFEGEAFEGKRPYVAWSEINKKSIFHVYVKDWDGEKWNQIGEDINIDSAMHALTPSITLKGHIPYVTWKETNQKGIYQIYVKHLEY